MLYTTSDKKHTLKHSFYQMLHQPYRQFYNPYGTLFVYLIYHGNHNSPTHLLALINLHRLRSDCIQSKKKKTTNKSQINCTDWHALKLVHENLYRE